MFASSLNSAGDKTTNRMCAYLLITGEPRKESVEECTKGIKGKRIKIKEYGYYGKEELEIAIEENRRD